MWGREWREALWRRLEGEPRRDLVVVGGGIAGAGILREAARAGRRALLLEARDFAWGTSSRSSKLVHGGIRYLQHGHWRLTRESLRERDRLLLEAPGLVEPLYFLRALYEGESRWLYRAAFLGYGLLSGRRQHAFHDAADVLRRAPALRAHGLIGAYGYGEAAVDDARLVLRLLRESVRAGAEALSYAPVEALVTRHGRVAGVRVRDAVTGAALEIEAAAVVNATGSAADRLRGEVGAAPALRPLRGSHLVYPRERLPLAQAIAMRHPADGRHVFMAPWEGASIVGTTDLDHDAGLDREPHISGPEAEYLMEPVRTYLPALGLGPADVIATWAGVRPVVRGRNADPSSESREGLVAEERGLVTVTGGKLTTVRPTALAALARLGGRSRGGGRLFDPVDAAGAAHPALDEGARRRLAGFHGADAAEVVRAARDGELEAIAGTLTLRAQLRFAVRAEGVVHLEDLLLRRTRIGLVLAAGGRALMPEVRALCAEELGWDAARWASEEARYRALWRAAHGPPPGGQSTSGVGAPTESSHRDRPGAGSKA